MRKTICNLFFSAAFILCGLVSAFAGFTYQNFEHQNGSLMYGWTNDPNVSVGFAGINEPVHSGERSWKMTCNGYWGDTAILSQVSPKNTDFNFSRNDRLTFWIYSLPGVGGDHTVGVKFFDRTLYKADGFEVWTTKTATYGNWTQLAILFSQLPDDFNLFHVNRIELKMYWPGVYYFDDIRVVRYDRAYQTFEPQLRSGSTVSEYGWRWNDFDTVDFAVSPEPVYEGLHSWKLASQDKWGGTGLQSEEKYLFKTAEGSEQSFWHVDLHPEKNKVLVLWVYGLPQNGMDNNMAIQLYDHNNHATDDTKVVMWTKKTAYFGAWSRLVIPFKELPFTLNLKDLDKIQLQQYWPGTYYFDDIKACGSLVKIDEKQLAKGIVKWDRVLGACQYIVEESKVGPDGPWQIVYVGSKNSFPVTGLTRLYYRVRWKECYASNNTVPYISEASDVAQYSPPAIFIKKKRLMEGFVEWPNIPGADEYEVQSAQRADGPWITIYRGPLIRNYLVATFGAWYRVRALKDSSSSAIAATDWSKPQSYAPGEGFLKQFGTMIKDENAKEVVLQGVNLGSLFLIERWMTGFGEADTPGINDEWSIRSVLTQKFSSSGCSRLLRTFYNAYINEADFNNLYNLGINLVRLPINYRLFQTEQGKWILDAKRQIDFSEIDRIVEYCQDRNIYVLLDLHGAPGSQSNEAHTGRENFNKLFENSLEGENYRRRTVKLWSAIAKHYKDNPTICGYDLLNEPIGAPSNEALWNLYNDIYKAIRSVDSNHIIMMEGIWGPETLPSPQSMGWENVSYQFHLYLYDYGEDVNAHKQFIDLQVAAIKAEQAEWQIPVMIGEFNCFSMRPIWEYYLGAFNRQRWSWAMWSYKTRFSSSEWGLYNHSGYPFELPQLRKDNFYKLAQKFNAYDTLNYHSPNFSLQEIIKEFAVPVQNLPFIKSILPETVIAGNDIVIKGANFADIQGQGAVFFDGILLEVVSWSDSIVKAHIPDSLSKPFGMVKIVTTQGESNEALLHIIHTN